MELKIRPAVRDESNPNLDSRDCAEACGVIRARVNTTAMVIVKSRVNVSS
jgi:hypothetical protein